MTNVRSSATVIESRDAVREPAAPSDGRLLIALTFALKTFSAALIALFIAFWLGLDEPRWALLTAYVVAQPESGLVLAKSFYRILGTIGGTLVAIGLVFALAQYGELFLASLAAWIGLCNFAARAQRNFASYGFILAGYTAAIIGIPAALNPSNAYVLAVSRMTEISLGIVCAGLVSRLVFPVQLTSKVVALVRDLARRADRLVGATLDPASDPKHLRQERVRFAADFATMEAMRASAFFESTEARSLNERLVSVTDAALDVVAIAGQIAVRREPASPSASTGSPSLAGLIGATDDTPRGNGAVVAALFTADYRHALAQSRIRLREAGARFADGSGGTRPSRVRRLWSDPVSAALTGVRSALAIAVTAAFWFATAWPSGPTAVIVAAIVCSLIASMEQPAKITLGLGIVIVLATVPIYATLFYLLPLASDFPSMAVALAPLLLSCGFIIAAPRIGPLGLLVVAYFSVVSNIDNVMTYDPVNFLNTFPAILVGIGVALTMFTVFFPETPASAARYFRRRLGLELGRLAESRGRSVEDFANALSDHLAMTLVRVKDEPAVASECFAGALTALSTAQAIDRLKSATKTSRLEPEVAAGGLRLLDHIARACLRPSRTSFTKCAWEARALRSRSLALARAASDGDETEALGAIIVVSEALRFDLLIARTVLPEQRHVR